MDGATNLALFCASLSGTDRGLIQGEAWTFICDPFDSRATGTGIAIATRRLLPGLTKVRPLSSFNPTQLLACLTLDQVAFSPDDTKIAPLIPDVDEGQ